MRITCDSVANAAYIYVVDEIGPSEAVRSDVSDIELKNAAIICDFDSDDRLLGMEILGARNVLRPETLNQAEHLA